MDGSGFLVILGLLPGFTGSGLIFMLAGVLWVIMITGGIIDGIGGGTGLPAGITTAILVLKEG